MKRNPEKITKRLYTIISLTKAKRDFSDVDAKLKVFLKNMNGWR